MNRSVTAWAPMMALGLLPVVWLACSGGEEPARDSAPGEPVTDAKADPLAAEAKTFVAEKNDGLRKVWVKSNETAWDYATNINDENQKKVAAAETETMGYVAASITESVKYDGVKGIDAETARQLLLLKTATTLPAPKDEALRTELADITTKMGGMYGAGKFCEGEKCQDLGELSDILATGGDYDTQLKAWEGWHTVSVPMRPLYTRFVELGNTGSKELGFADMGVLWRSNYDMTPAEVEAEADRLWGQVKPLYDQLHCHVRAKLSEKYGAEKVPANGLIPAHLTGNMWAQSWEGIYPLVEPHPGKQSLDVSKTLEAQKWDPIKMVKTGEGFFTSMGLDPMPATFWERSMFVKPEGRDVECHASAWDVGMNDDERIKMCIKPTMDDLVTIHHELGHNYYNHYYYQLPVLYQEAAHDGFHEAVGDAVALSITPTYLKQIGLLEDASMDPEAVLNQQMYGALAKIAFLPFGRMIDQWRWDVFSGKIPADKYNAGWWELRAKYQGVAAPSARGEEFFDAGAKYHIPGNTPYLRYFFAHILQFQFHKAMCEAAGNKGPLHECSVYGSKPAGDKLKAMLSMGASKPWPDALEAMAGTRQMDAAPLVEYFDPLMQYLKKENEGRQCGW